MDGFTEVMVDIETTGTLPDRHNILQIAAVKFDLEPEFKISMDDMFDRTLLEVPHRSWSEDTRNWWDGQPSDLLLGLQSRAQDPGEVMKEFQFWAYKDGIRPRFWSKPLSFDFPFIQSYFVDFRLSNPFKFWESVDARSWVAGRYSAMGRPPLSEKDLTFEGVKHNALHDVLHQVRWIAMTHQQTGVVLET